MHVPQKGDSMRRIVLEHNGQSIDINPDEIDDLIAALAGIKKKITQPPPDMLTVSSSYLTYQQAGDLLDALTPGGLSEKAVQFRVGRIWMACQRRGHYGNIPYEGFCRICGVQIADDWKHGKPCLVYDTSGAPIVVSKLSIILNRDQFAAITYRGATPAVKSAYQLLVDHLIENGIT